MASLRDAFAKAGFQTYVQQQDQKHKREWLESRGLTKSQESATARTASPMPVSATTRIVPIPHVKVVLGVVKRASGLSVVEVEYWSKRRH